MDLSAAYKNHADAVYKEFMSLKYGINVCCNKKSIDELEIDKELCDWKKLTGRDLLSEVQLRRFANKPIYIGGEIDDTYYVGRTLDGAGFNYQYSYNSEQNIIEVNVGGSITRINVNPNITINGGSYQYHNTNSSDTWTSQCIQCKKVQDSVEPQVIHFGKNRFVLSNSLKQSSHAPLLHFWQKILLSILPHRQLVLEIEFVMLKDIII